MSGSFVNANEAGVAADIETMASQIAGVIARVQQRQAESAAFVAQWGAQVLNGHTQVGDMVPPVLAGVDASTNESASSVSPPYELA